MYHLCQLALPTPVLGEPRLQPCYLRVMTRQPAASYHMIGDSVQTRGRWYSTHDFANLCEMGTYTENLGAREQHANCTQKGAFADLIQGVGTDDMKE